MIKGTGRGRRVDEFAVGKLNIEPQSRDRSFEIRKKRGDSGGGHRPILVLTRELRGKQRSLEAFGLRPKPRIGIMDGEIVEQQASGENLDVERSE